jgi:hypothetical protein
LFALALGPEVKEITMLDHAFISVSDIDRSIDYDPRYYAASVLDPDGYSLEFTYKSWQH